MSRRRPVFLTHKNPISVDPSIPNSLESIRFAPISVEPPHTPPSHPPPTIALPLYTLTPEPTPITTLAAPTAPPSRTNRSMIDAPYRRARTLSRPLTFLTYQLDPRPPFCDTTTFSHPLRPTLMTYARRTHSQTLNFTLSYHLYISPTTRDQQPSPDYTCPRFAYISYDVECDRSDSSCLHSAPVVSLASLCVVPIVLLTNPLPRCVVPIVL